MTFNKAIGYASKQSKIEACEQYSSYSFDALTAVLTIETDLRKTVKQGSGVNQTSYETCTDPPCSDNPCPDILAPQAMGYDTLYGTTTVQVCAACIALFFINCVA